MSFYVMKIQYYKVLFASQISKQLPMEQETTSSKIGTPECSPDRLCNSSTCLTCYERSFESHSKVSMWSSKNERALPHEEASHKNVVGVLGFGQVYTSEGKAVLPCTTPSGEKVEPRLNEARLVRRDEKTVCLRVDAAQFYLPFWIEIDIPEHLFCSAPDVKK